jgi:tetratricopeptide (TPR) repeat protein
MQMLDVSGVPVNLDQVRERMRLGNRYAANKEWGRAMSMFSDSLELLYAPYFLNHNKNSPVQLPDYWCTDALLFDDGKKRDASGSQMYTDFLKLRQQLGRPEQSPMAGFPFRRGLTGSSEIVWHVVFPSHTPGKYGAFTDSIPDGAFASYILAPGAVSAVSDSEVVALMAYAWAHLANTMSAKLDELYQLHQILDGRAIPAMEQVDQMYEQALFLKPDQPWALAHRGELQRHLANCLLDEDLKPQCSQKRLKRYVKSIAYLRRAIDIYDDQHSTNGPRNRHYSWACAHLGAAVVNARAFVGILGKEDPGMQELLADWPADWPDREPPSSAVLQKPPQDPVEFLVQFLNRAMKMLLLALQSAGSYYPWAHSYYSASLLLKGALDDKLPSAVATQVATLGQVTSSQAYYLEPGLLKDVFEPVQLGVNPPFELAVIHYSKAVLHSMQEHPDLVAAAADCRQAWHYAWIGMRWLFKYRFQEGLQGLTVCALLVKVALLYGTMTSQSGTSAETEPCGAEVEGGDCDLIQASRLKILDGSWGTSPLFKLPTEIITKREDLVAFIHEAVRCFAGWQLQLLLNNKTKLNSNIITGLVWTDHLIDHFMDDIKQLKGEWAELSSLSALRCSINRMVGGKPNPDHSLMSSGQRTLHFLFSVITGDFISIDQLKGVGLY